MYGKKLFCAMLIFSAMAIALAFLSACSSPGGEGGGGKDATDGGATEGGGVEEATLDPAYIEELPEADYGGQTFTFLSYGDGTKLTWHAMDLVAEEETGDALNDAIIKRNRSVEERFGVKIEAVFGGSVAKVDRLVKSGGDDFDAAWLNMSESGSCAQTGHYLNFDALGYINLKKGYWDQSVGRDLSVAGKVYFSTGDISIVDKRATWIMMFNKVLLGRYEIESPYALVRKGEWTIDKFLETAKNTSRNLNGTGTWDKYDQYGFATTNDTIIGLFYSCGERVVTKDANDMLEFAYNDSARLGKLHDILEKTVHIMKKDNITLCTADISGGEPWKATQAAFEENRALFYGEVLAYVVNLRAMETDFGIIPMPKYNKEQKSYISFVNSAACFLGVPVTCGDPEMVGTIIEAMAAESSRTLRPAYYDVLLKEKGARDEESGEMLDLIFQNRSYDLGLIYDYGSIVSSFVKLAAKGDTDAASMIESQRAKAETKISEFNEKFLNLG